MGYDLFIKRSAISDPLERGYISLEQWDAVAEQDDELEPAGELGSYLWQSISADPGMSLIEVLFSWSDGTIHSKNPGPEGIQKMRMLASRLNAAVVGADGEIYDELGIFRPPVSPRRRFFDALKGVILSLLPARPAPDPGFAPGDRVKDIWSNQGTVQSVDRKAMRGVGRIVVKYDDGRISQTSIVGGTIFTRIG